MTASEGARGAAAAGAGADLKERIVHFARQASLEITPHDRSMPASLVGRLPAGTTLYVTHTPNTTLHEVVELAGAVERAGFAACPHIAARRIHDREELAVALATLEGLGITRALLIAGDLDTPAGPYTSTLDILESGLLAGSGITSIGVAGHPEGHPRVSDAALWDALERKQAHGARSGVSMHIVSQFGFDASALAAWDRELAAHGIALPVHAGIAGPATLKSLARFAILCGIGASLRALLTSPSALATLRSLVRTVDEIFPDLVRLHGGALGRRVVKPHFFAFGGVMKTVEWLESVRAGRFDIDAGTGALAVRG
ncbi:MAG: methylenetetrahydrofolate reductase [Steroidobacteraceae bacterium]